MTGGMEEGNIFVVTPHAGTLQPTQFVLLAQELFVADADQLITGEFPMPAVEPEKSREYPPVV